MKLGIVKSQICIDPGIGFGKTREHNHDIFYNLKRFVSKFDYVMLGSSRKRFLRDIVEETDAKEILEQHVLPQRMGFLKVLKFLEFMK